jgi:WD40 repeat protein
LRGGSHLHVWDASGDWLCFTYNDALVESDVRDVGVAIPGKPVHVSKSHPRNHDGNYFCALVTRTTTAPKPGSNEIGRAFEEAWIGTNGYVRSDGTRRPRALAFQGNVVTTNGGTNSEVFVADLPEELAQSGDGPLAGTSEHRPCPPKGVAQRRLTFTTRRKYPGLQGPRHWLRSSPDGSRIAFLMKDDAGIVQLWTISPNGGTPAQMTHNAHDIASAFTWSPDGRGIAHVMDKSVCVTDVATGGTSRLTPPYEDTGAPRPEACVFSPDGNKIAFVRRIKANDSEANQICVVFLKGDTSTK